MPTWTEVYEWATPEEQTANNPPIRTKAFVAKLFRIEAQVLETALAVQLAPDAQHLAARQAAQIADPVEIREGDYVLLKYPDLITSCRRASTKDPNAL
jgi:hypothetical protein